MDGPAIDAAENDTSTPRSCALLVVVGEPASEEHKELILQRIVKGFHSWDITETGCDINEALKALVTEAPRGEEGQNGDVVIVHTSEHLETRILVNPLTSTLQSSIQGLLTSQHNYVHIVYAGHQLSGPGSWVLQDSVYPLSSLASVFKDAEVDSALKLDKKTVTVSCQEVGEWTGKQEVSKMAAVNVNVADRLTDLSEVNQFAGYVSDFVAVLPATDRHLASDVVGNIRFNKPTLYIFPGSQGDSSLFGVSGFNLLVNGGYGRNACFWPFTRHLDRIDAMLVTHLSSNNMLGLSNVLERKVIERVHPEIGFVYMNTPEHVKHSPNGDALPEEGGTHKAASLVINLVEEGNKMVENMRKLQCPPQSCVRNVSDCHPVNLYHKVGHGSLDMYVLNPVQDSKELKDFFQQWKNHVDHFSKVGNKSNSIPLPQSLSICALLVWRPSSPTEKITRLLFPGSTPQSKIFEGLDKLKQLDILKHPECTQQQLQAKPSAKKAVDTGKASRASVKSAPPKAATAPKKPVTDRPTAGVDKNKLQKPKDTNKTGTPKKGRKSPIASPAPQNMVPLTRSPPSTPAAPESAKESTPPSEDRAREPTPPVIKSEPDVITNDDSGTLNEPPMAESVEANLVDGPAPTEERVTPEPEPVEDEKQEAIEPEPSLVEEDNLVSLSDHREPSVEEVQTEPDFDSLVDTKLTDEGTPVDIIQDSLMDADVPDVLLQGPTEPDQEPVPTDPDQLGPVGETEVAPPVEAWPEYAAAPSQELDSPEPLPDPDHFDDSGFQARLDSKISNVVEKWALEEKEVTHEEPDAAEPDPVDDGTDEQRPLEDDDLGLYDMKPSDDVYEQPEPVEPCVSIDESVSQTSSTPVECTPESPGFTPGLPDMEQPASDNLLDLGDQPCLDPDQADTNANIEVDRQYMELESEQNLVPEGLPMPEEPEFVSEQYDVEEHKPELLKTDEQVDVPRDEVEAAPEQRVGTEFEGEEEELFWGEETQTTDVEVMAESQPMDVDLMDADGTSVDSPIPQQEDKTADSVTEQSEAAEEQLVEKDAEALDEGEPEAAMDPKIAMEPDVPDAAFSDEGINEPIGEEVAQIDEGAVTSDDDEVDAEQEELIVEESQPFEESHSTVEASIEEQRVDDSSNVEQTSRQEVDAAEVDLEQAVDSGGEEAAMSGESEPEPTEETEEQQPHSPEEDEEQMTVLESEKPAFGTSPTEPDDEVPPIAQDVVNATPILDQPEPISETSFFDQVELPCEPHTDRPVDNIQSPGEEVVYDGVESIESQPSDNILTPDDESPFEGSGLLQAEPNNQGSDIQPAQETSAFNGDAESPEPDMVKNAIDDLLMAPSPSEQEDIVNSNNVPAQPDSSQNKLPDLLTEWDKPMAQPPPPEDGGFDDGYIEGATAACTFDPLEDVEILKSAHLEDDLDLLNGKGQEGLEVKVPDDRADLVASWGEPMALPSPPLPAEPAAGKSATKKSTKTTTTKKTTKTSSTKGDATTNGIDKVRKSAAAKTLANKSTLGQPSRTPSKSQTASGKASRTLKADTTKEATPKKAAVSPKPKQIDNKKLTEINKRPASAPVKGDSVLKRGTPTAKRPMTAVATNGRASSVTKSASLVTNPCYVDLTYVPNHSDPLYSDVEFFKRVRARFYVFSGLSPNPSTLNALLEAKATWEDKGSEVTIIPTYDTDTLRHWMGLNRQTLGQMKIEVAPSANRCTIQLQDHNTSCNAYRLEF